MLLGIFLVWKFIEIWLLENYGSFKKVILEKVLDKFVMSNLKAMRIWLANHFKLSLDQCPKTDAKVDSTSNISYASIIGCLMYDMVCTRPYLPHVIG